MTNEFEAGDVDFPPPPTERAAQYAEMRRMAQDLSSRMLKVDGLVHPRTAARAMGIEVYQQNIVFEGEWEMDVLTEYSLYYHRSKGTRHFERVLERESLNTEERSYLETNRRAYASVFEVGQTRPELWELDLVDRLGKREPVTMMDRNASATLPPGLLIFARLLDHGALSTTTGVSLPVAAGWAADDEREFVLRRCRAALRSPGKRTPEHALFYICRKLHLRLGIEMVYR